MCQYGVVTDWDYPRTAEKLRGYFGRQEGACEEWIDGLRAAECWLACLTEGQTPTRLSECDDLIAAGHKYTGSGWVELQIAYSTWRANPGRESEIVEVRSIRLSHSDDDGDHYVVLIDPPGVEATLTVLEVIGFRCGSAVSFTIS
jgi:hypothetical protein